MKNHTLFVLGTRAKQNCYHVETGKTDKFYDSTHRFFYK